MKNRNIFLAALFLFLCFASPSFAFWMWTPETNEWINPKYAVKETPAEQLTYSKALYESKDYKAAINEFEKLIKFYPRSKEAAEAQYLIGLSLEEQDKLFEAYKAYQKGVEKYPFSDLSPEIIERQYKIGERLMDGEGKKSGFVSAVIGGSYDVIDVFRTVIKNAPYGKYAAISQYKIGLYLEERGLFQEARDELEKVVNDYPESEWVKPAKYQIAVVDSKRSTDAQYDQKVTQAAVKEFNDFVAIYPDAELSQKAKQQIDQLKEKEAENNFLVARFYEKQKNSKSAKLYYEIVLNDFKGTTWAPKALEKLKQLEAKASKEK